MRTMTFSVLGAAGGSTAVQGTVLDLLVAIPYLFAAQFIPPWHVLRRVEADTELASLVMAHRGKGTSS